MYSLYLIWPGLCFLSDENSISLKKYLKIYRAIFFIGNSSFFLKVRLVLGDCAFILESFFRYCFYSRFLADVIRSDTGIVTKKYQARDLS